MKVGEINLKCMALLDQANTETYGDPVPVTVPLTVEKGPFIVISGHDLKDLQLLLEQTEGKGINIYTNGEMLPAHAYPKLKAYPHLKGNFGTAWHNQQKEFADIPAPVLFTTNCLMPPKASYADRVFTTEVVSYPGVIHIGEDKDFTPVIEKALELGGLPGRSGIHRNQRRKDSHHRICAQYRIIRRGYNRRRSKRRSLKAHFPCRRMRRSEKRPQLLYGFCKADAFRYGSAHSRLREIPVQ